ncbi:MAG: glycosyltransferase family 4 protein, partial [Acidobacteriota bacterium]
EPVCAHLGEDVVGGRYNVGLWLWELPDFPDALRGAFAPFHEIWTPSTFCADALSAKSPVPVRRVPLPVHVPPVAKVEAAGRAARRRLELDDDVFVALYLFNYLSVFERKNPLAAVEAFRRAFGTDASKRLILKTSQADYAPPAHARLLEAARDLPNVTILDAYLDREEIEGLLAACDVYLSLHRSEGYGLTVAEAMARGKVAVATPWSGVADFVDVNNGRPVRFALERLETDVGPYPAGSRWADPDVDDAARALRELATDVELRRQLGERARHDIEAHLSSDAVGRLLRQRVDEIVRRTRRPRPPGPDLEPGR